jgi:hypothetical protein
LDLARQTFPSKIVRLLTQKLLSGLLAHKFFPIRWIRDKKAETGTSQAVAGCELQNVGMKALTIYSKNI